MAVYTLTVNTNANEEKGLDWVLEKVNADRAAEVPPRNPLTKTQYLDNLANGLTKSYRKAYLEDLRNRIGEAMNTASNAQITAVATELGITE